MPQSAASHSPPHAQPEPVESSTDRFGHSRSSSIILSLMLPVWILVLPPLVARQRLRPPGKVETLSALPEQISPRNAALFTSYRTELEREGFRSGGLALMHDLIFTNPNGPSERMVIESFEHKQRKHIASLILFVPREKNHNPAPVIRFLELLDDGTRVVTWNSPEPPLYPRAHTTHGLRMPRVKNVAELYAIQRGLLQRFTPSYVPRGLPDGGTASAVAQENQRETNGWIARRWILPTDRPGEFRNAWWLAVRMAWGLMPPIGYLRSWLMRRHNERLRAAWGL